MNSYGINTKDDILGIITYSINKVSSIYFFKSKNCFWATEIINILIAPDSGHEILFHQRREAYQ